MSLPTAAELSRSFRPAPADAERCYLLDRLQQLRVTVALLEERADVAPEPDARALLARAARQRTRAERIIEYLRTGPS